MAGEPATSQVADRRRDIPGGTLESGRGVCVGVASGSRRGRVAPVRPRRVGAPVSGSRRAGAPAWGWCAEIGPGRLCRGRAGAPAWGWCACVGVASRRCAEVGPGRLCRGRAGAPAWGWCACVGVASSPRGAGAPVSGALGSRWTGSDSVEPTGGRTFLMPIRIALDQALADQAARFAGSRPLSEPVDPSMGTNRAFQGRIHPRPRLWGRRFHGTLAQWPRDGRSAKSRFAAVPR
jgi:hypothetical protein